MCSYFGPLKKVGTERSILFYGSHVACAFFSLFLEVRADARIEQESVEKGQNNINSSENTEKWHINIENNRKYYFE